MRTHDIILQHNKLHTRKTLIMLLGDSMPIKWYNKVNVIHNPSHYFRVGF